jgi:hypothetical protein
MWRSVPVRSAPVRASPLERLRIRADHLLHEVRVAMPQDAGSRDARPGGAARDPHVWKVDVGVRLCKESLSTTIHWPRPCAEACAAASAVAAIPTPGYHQEAGGFEVVKPIRTCAGVARSVAATRESPIFATRAIHQ